MKKYIFGVSVIIFLIVITLAYFFVNNSNTTPAQIEKKNIDYYKACSRDNDCVLVQGLKCCNDVINKKFIDEFEIFRRENGSDCLSDRLGMCLNDVYRKGVKCKNKVCIEIVPLPPE